MLVEFKRPAASYAYFCGDVAELDDKAAKKLINSGHCVPHIDSSQLKSELPEDFPLREVLLKAGFIKMSQMLEMKGSLDDIPGIGKASAAKIAEYIDNIPE